MNFLKKVNALILGLTILLAVGCGKDDDTTPDQKNAGSGQGNFTRCLYTQNTANGTTYTFVYNAKGQMIQTNGPSGRTGTIEYDSAGFMTKTISYSGPSSYSYSTYAYNSDTLVIKETHFLRYNASDPFFISGIRRYTYDSQKRLIKHAWYNSPDTTNVYSQTNITYSPNGQKTENYGHNYVTNAWELQSEGEVTAYDNQKTPGQGLTFFTRLSTSQHNPLQGNGKVYQNGVLLQSESFTVSYTYNSAGYPVESVRTTSGKSPVTTTYGYTCQ